MPRTGKIVVQGGKNIDYYEIAVRQFEQHILPPSMGLSPILVKENFAIIRRINERGITVFLVEQNVRQTLAIADFGYVMSKGRIVAAGTPEALSDTKEVHEAYFG